jgi:hypothetical protein
MSMKPDNSARLDADTLRAINNLSRGDIERALNWGGYATYDHELTSELRECLRGCVADGEIHLELVVL